MGFIKKCSDPLMPLCRIQTDQLKGIAVLMVIVGHLWVHVSLSPIPLIFSGDAVALFLFFSGYGLTISDKSNQNAIVFFSKRIRRVMIPYWGTTFLILFLDWLLLRKIYSFPDILMTFLGINLYATTKNIDYVRWYITFILLWYVLYFFAQFVKKKYNRLFFLFFCAGVLFLLSYYIFHFGWYQFFAFPLGCAVALKYEWLREIFEKKKGQYMLLGLLSFAIAITYKLAMFNMRIFTFVDAHIPSIVISLANELHSILLCIGLLISVVFFGYKKRYSAFLVFCGGISYELFLLHGAFLVKYNPIVISTNPVFLTAGFMSFTFSLILLSYWYQKMISIF